MLARCFLGLRPEDGNAVDRCAYIETAAGSLDTACDLFREAMEKGNASSIAGLACALLYRGGDDDIQQALTILEEQVDGTIGPPGQLGAPALFMNTLAWKWLTEDTPRSEVAETIAQEAVDLDPGNGMIHDTLAYAKYLNGDLDGSLEHYGIALKTGPTAAVVGRAMALLKRGYPNDIAEACDLLESRYAARYVEPYTGIAYAALRTVQPGEGELQERIEKLLAAPPEQ